MQQVHFAINMTVGCWIINKLRKYLLIHCFYFTFCFYPKVSLFPPPPPISPSRNYILSLLCLFLFWIVCPKIFQPPPHPQKCFLIVYLSIVNIEQQTRWITHFSCLMTCILFNSIRQLSGSYIDVWKSAAAKKSAVLFRAQMLFSSFDIFNCPPLISFKACIKETLHTLDHLSSLSNITEKKIKNKQKINFMFDHITQLISTYKITVLIFLKIRSSKGIRCQRSFQLKYLPQANKKIILYRTPHRNEKQSFFIFCLYRFMTRSTDISQINDKSVNGKKCKEQVRFCIPKLRHIFFQLIVLLLAVAYYKAMWTFSRTV